MSGTCRIESEQPGSWHMIDLNGVQHYIHWHFITITWANVIVIALMIVVFIAALFLPYPGSNHPVSADEEADPATDTEV